MDYTKKIEEIYQGIATGDLEPMWEVLSPDAEWIEAENIPYSTGGPILGREAVTKAVFEELGSDFADFHVNASRIVAGQSTVLVEGRYVGTTKTGNALDAIFAHVWDFDGDSIVKFQQYSDTHQWRRVLGADA